MDFGWSRAGAALLVEYISEHIVEHNIRMLDRGLMKFFEERGIKVQQLHLAVRKGNFEVGSFSQTESGPVANDRIGRPNAFFLIGSNRHFGALKSTQRCFKAPIRTKTPKNSLLRSKRKCSYVANLNMSASVL